MVSHTASDASTAMNSVTGCDWIWRSPFSPDTARHADLQGWLLRGGGLHP